MVEEAIGQIIKNEKSICQIIEDDIAYVYYYENSVLHISDLKETLEAYNELAQGTAIKILSEFGEYCTATSEARAFGETIDLYTTAEAMVFTSLAQRLLLRAFMLFKKQNHPFKIFDSKEAAIKWLKSV